ncbi:hypothetical protein Rwratislav_46580 [Rhodococcus wratislaviensis IFP 2016]|nr:hypothetical protein Rwratislav_46580 [Rhodococcus wratislaviensis IFP 2016]
MRVLSSPTLHAKVIATNARAVIGSANASENSTLADDAVVITDDPEIIASVRKFIDSLDEITEVDQVFLDDAILEWEIGRAVPLPGVTGRVRIETDFLPTPGDPDVRQTRRRLRTHPHRTTGPRRTAGPPSQPRRPGGEISARIASSRQAQRCEAGRRDRLRLGR